MDISQLGLGIIIGGIGTIALGFARKTGGMLAEDSYRRLHTLIFGRSVAEENEDVLETVQQVREEKTRMRQKLEQAESRISDYDRLTQSLKSRNISRDELVEHYWDPLHAIIICFTNQKDAEGNQMRFLKNELTRRYNLKQLTGDIYIIPPNQTPERLRQVRKARNEIEELLNEEVYSNYPNAKSTIAFAARVDLRDVYSRTDHEPEDRMNMINTIDEVLGLDDIFSQNDFSKALASENVNLSDVVEEGSLPFLASDYVSHSELEDIIEKEEHIKEQLGQPSLRDIAYNVEAKELAESLAPYVADAERVSDSIITEAKIWCRELYNDSEEFEIKDEQQSPEAAI